MLFVETPIFEEERERHLSDEELRKLQAALAAEPTAGAVVPGLGGLRKIRWPDRRRRRGKQGGLRVIYYYVAPDTTIFLVYVYAKAEQEDLTPEQERALRRIMEEG